MRFLLAGCLFLLLPSAALPDTLKAVRPGLICAHADALAALTRPDGSSRAGDDVAHAALKQSGGCFDLHPGDVVTVLQARHNTSVVHFAGRWGTAEGTYLIANIDFAKVSDPPAHAAPQPATPPASPALPAAQMAPPPPAPTPSKPEDTSQTPPTGMGAGQAPASDAKTGPSSDAPAAAKPASSRPPPPALAVVQKPPSAPAEPASPPAPAPTNDQPMHGPDIARLRLGMPKAEAVSKLDTHLNIQDRNLSDPDRNATVAFTDHGLLDGQDAYEAYMLEFIHGRLAFVHHAQVFASGSEPLAAQVAAALIAKYGRDTDGSTRDPDMSWSRGEGDQAIGLKQSQACLDTPQDRVPLRGLVTQGSATRYDAGLVPKGGPDRTQHKADKLCSTLLTAKAQRDPANANLVKRLDVTLFDAGAFFALDDARQARLKDKKAAAAQAARANQMHL